MRSSTAAPLASVTASTTRAAGARPSRRPAEGDRPNRRCHSPGTGLPLVPSCPARAGHRTAGSGRSTDPETVTVGRGAEWGAPRERDRLSCGGHHLHRRAVPPAGTAIHVFGAEGLSVQPESAGLPKLLDLLQRCGRGRVRPGRRTVRGPRPDAGEVRGLTPAIGAGESGRGRAQRSARGHGRKQSDDAESTHRRERSSNRPRIRAASTAALRA